MKLQALSNDVVRLVVVSVEQPGGEQAAKK